MTKRLTKKKKYQSNIHWNTNFFFSKENMNLKQHRGLMSASSAGFHCKADVSPTGSELTRSTQSSKRQLCLRSEQGIPTKSMAPWWGHHLTQLPPSLHLLPVCMHKWRQTCQLNALWNWSHFLDLGFFGIVYQRKKMSTIINRKNRLTLPQLASPLSLLTVVGEAAWQASLSFQKPLCTRQQGIYTDIPMGPGVEIKLFLD